MSLKQHVYRSRWESIFRILLVLFFASLAAYLFFIIYNYILQQRIEDRQTLVEQQNQELIQLQQITGYNRLVNVRQLEAQTNQMPRSAHIPQVISMLEDLQDIDTSDSETIVLSDFVVSLDRISLKGRVSNLLLLYYTSESRGFQALLDRFAALEFIDNMRVQTYNKVGDRYFEFLLEADVINDDQQ